MIPAGVEGGADEGVPQPSCAAGVLVGGCLSAVSSHERPPCASLLSARGKSGDARRPWAWVPLGACCSGRRLPWAFPRSVSFRIAGPHERAFDDAEPASAECEETGFPLTCGQVEAPKRRWGAFAGFSGSWQGVLYSSGPRSEWIFSFGASRPITYGRFACRLTSWALCRGAAYFWIAV